MYNTCFIQWQISLNHEKQNKKHLVNVLGCDSCIKNSLWESVERKLPLVFPILINVPIP